ncbi:homolog to virus structural protein HRPV2-VP5 [Natronomonas pharaonis DSM 2160]|uniref:Homolog to virus structural protein HRPV2-VP5 n=1 Tax=Natronomonas pharaonis (strain ATCC 35678 / DSM 2160 / CIP 103997 / JCM 8858 / NBRC 14720 / NCIMB 2260 / Gabara) TaxID=348780 RepID=A0A1U7EZP1_NATPD|nr:hypothetical protein [Natronomonas pharaonis]CAI50765.1 homolog to virus structural protein HRPV2-VP5 [Natronomonas pharaonis DSM 2160]
MSSDVGKSGSTDDGEPETYHTAGANIGQSRLSRRGFVRAATAATAATAVGAGGLASQTAEAEALIPAIPVGAAGAAKAAGAIGGSAAVGWALREFEVLGSDTPPEGLTQDALKQEAYQTLRTRYSTNQSTFIDNENILEGIEHTAYTEGKLDAIKELNEQSPQDDVYSAAESTVNEQEATVLKNLLESWNETVVEVGSVGDAINEHSDLPEDEVFDDYSTVSYETDKFDYELPTGEVFGLNGLFVRDWRGGGAGEGYYSIFEKEQTGDYTPSDNAPVDMSGEDYEDYEDFILLDDSEWRNLVTDIEDTFDEVRSGLAMWVDEVYGEVQSGELDVEDLVTPRERAEMMAEDEDFPQAVADLIALNMPVDVEREATIHIPEYDATLRGSFATTSEDLTLEVGEIYDPDDLDDDLYFTYDISQGEGIWSDYDESVDGGVATFTDKPFPDTLYRIETGHGETVEVTRSDFNESDGYWEIDLSDQLETAITEIESVSYYADTDETRYETVQIKEPFEVEKFEDSDGEEYDSAEFERFTEPQEDDNYITQEEWNEMEQRNDELIEKYEEAHNDGLGIGGGIDLGGIGGWFSGIGQSAAAAGAGVLALIFAGIALGGE